MKRIILFILIALIAALPALAETTYYGTMMVDNCEEWVSLRDGPGTGCGRLAKVPLYAIVTDAEQGPFTGDFIRCCYDGQYGYIMAKYLVPWADPEPEANASFTGGPGFSFDYDDSVLAVDADSSEDGQSLLLRPRDGDEPVYLEIMTAKSVGMRPSEFLRENAPADAVYEEGETAGGLPVHWFRAADGDVVRVCYAVDGAEDALVAVGTCPSEGGAAWIAQFNAVMQSITTGSAAPVRADWAEATNDLLVVDRDGEYVTLMADEPVTKVALLALELVDAETFFDTTVLYEQDELVPDDPLVVKIAFPGDIPGYGIRFTDGDGRVRQFAIGMSGRDGSLVLSEF